MTLEYVIADFSKHNGRIDAQKLKAKGIKAVALRATIGEFYRDPLFHENWDRIKAVGGIKLTAYFVTVPEQDPTHQVANFKMYLGEKVMDWPPIVDVEIDNGQSPSLVTNTNKRVLELTRSVFNVAPFIYVRGNWARTYLQPWDGWKDFPLIIARYKDIQHPWSDDERTNPKHWPDYFAWQRTADGNNLGDAYGAESDDIDLSVLNPKVSDYFDSEEDDMTEAKLDLIIAKLDLILQKIGQAPTTPPPQPPPAVVYRVQVVGNGEKPHALLSVQVGQNAANPPKPIMELYPSDSSLSADRIKVPVGDQIVVKPAKVDADGPIDYYELVELKGRKGETLYIQAPWVVKLW